MRVHFVESCGTGENAAASEWARSVPTMSDNTPAGGILLRVQGAWGCFAVVRLSEALC